MIREARSPQASQAPWGDSSCWQQRGLWQTKRRGSVGEKGQVSEKRDTWSPAVWLSLQLVPRRQWLLPRLLIQRQEGEL